MQMKNTMRYYFPPTSMAIIKKWKMITSVGKDADKFEPS